MKPQPNQTSQRIGFAMQRARRTTMIPRSHLARLMNITITQLNRYETGREEIPDHILESIFTRGYMMMHIKNLNRYYREMAHLNIKMSAYQQSTKNVK